MLSVAITDHLDAPGDVPAHTRIRSDIEAVEPNIAVYSGVDLGFPGTRCSRASDSDYYGLPLGRTAGTKELNALLS